jgi:tripartite-type tricarboxylate transporter receptor subunit TctC
MPDVFNQETTMIRTIAATIALSFGASGLLTPLTASAQSYPSRPIKLIVPFPPAGAADLVSRSFAQKLTTQLGQAVVIENRPGADTIIGMGALAKSTPDGYTLGLVLNSSLTMNPALYAKLPYDATKDFASISIVASVPLVLVSNPTTNAGSASELAALAKAKPDQLSYGAGNIVARLAAELFLSQSGGKAVGVMYKGSAPTLTDLIRGDVQFAFEPLAVVMPHVNSGKLRALGVAETRRNPTSPDLPTLAEGGLPGFEVPVWFGFMAPAGTAREVLARLQDEISKAALDPEVRDRLTGAGFEVGATTPAQFTTRVAAERESWSKRIQAWGIKLEQ